MDTVIEKISEIESAATSIMDSANERKKAFAQEMAERTADFDDQLEAETEKKLEKLRTAKEEDLKARLEEQKKNSEKAMASLETYYEKNHARLTENLFNNMIKE